MSSSPSSSSPPSPTSEKSLPLDPISFKRAISESIAGPRKRQRTIEESYCGGTNVPTSTQIHVTSPHIESCLLSAVSSLAQFLIEERCIPSVIKMVAELMAENISNWNIQYNGFRLLTERGGPTHLGARDYVLRLIDGMRAHPGDSLLQLEALRGLLHWMRMDEDVLREVGTSVYMSIIMDTLTTHADVLRLRRIVLDILRTLICSSAVQLEVIASHGKVVSSLMRLLENSIADVCTQQVGLSILSWIIEEKTSRDIIFEEGGIEIVLKVMKEHPFDEICQCNGAATLCWLIHTAGTSGSLGLGPSGFATVVETMKRFLNNPMVFGNSICVLCGALMGDLTRAESETVELVKLTLLGMGIHRYSPKVHRNGLTLLRFLTATANTDALAMVLKDLDVVKQAMLLHPEDAAIQAEACNVLAHIGTFDDARAMISSSGCIEAVVKCQVNHRCNLRVQHAALLFHSRLLEGQHNEAHAAFGGDVRILAAMTSGIVLLERQNEAQ